jgi:hypothetical protein
VTEPGFGRPDQEAERPKDERGYQQEPQDVQSKAARTEHNEQQKENY